MQTVRQWLEQLGLPQYAEAFERNAVDLKIVRELTQQDLQDLGVEALGHRKVLLRAIAELNATPTPAATPRPVQDQPPSQRPLAAEAERRQLTVMFCDLVGSTALSARLDPEELREVVRAYQASCAQVIEHYDGHIAQYLGDGLLVYFGYPQAHEDDAQRAVHAALGIIEAMHDLSRRERDRGASEVSVRVGIHTGLVVVGNVGAGGRHEQLALGETPNLAARLQSIAEADTVVISAATQRLVQGLFITRDLGSQLLKGAPVPVQAFSVLGESGMRTRLEAAASSGLTQLVGREEEVGLLLERWGRVIEGEKQVVLLVGEPGIGKSRLVQVLKERIATGAHTLLECRCSPYYEHSPLYPIIDVLSRLLGMSRQDTPETKLDRLETWLTQCALPTSQLMPLLGSLLALPASERFPLPAMSPERQKRLTFEALVAIFVALSAQRPALLIVEDLHWIDPSSLELLTQLLEQVPGAKLFILLTSRPSFESPWTPRSDLSLLTLNRFTPTQTEVMVSNIARGKSLPAEVVQQIVTKTDGVALFVEELTKMVLESSLLAERGDRYELAAPLPPLAIPATLQDSLMARLDRLATVRDVAQLAATLGRAFPYALLQAVSPLDEALLERELGRLVEAEILYQRGVSPQVTYVFKHALIQDAAYESLLRSTRQQYHQQIAKVMVEKFAKDAETRPEFVAHHYTQAGLSRQAADYWLRAGQQAGGRLAYAEAIAHYQKGIEVLSSLPDTQTRFEQEVGLQIALGYAYIPTKGYTAPEAIRAFTRARELCEQVGATASLFSALYGLCLFYFVRTEYRTALGFAKECLALGERMGATDMLVEAHWLLGSTLFMLGDCVSARAHCEACIAAYDPDAHRSHTLLYGQDPKVAALAWLSYILLILGYADQALERTREVRALAEQRAHPFSRGFALCFTTIAHEYRGEPQAAKRSADALLALGVDQGFAFWTGLGEIHQTIALGLQGSATAEDIAKAKAGVAFLRAVGAEDPALFFFPWLAELQLLAGLIQEGLETASEGLRLMIDHDRHQGQPHLYLLMGELLLKLPVPDESQAETYFLRALELAHSKQERASELRAATSLALLWQKQGKRAQARELLAPIYTWFTEGFDTKDLKDAKALLHELS